MCIRDSPYTQTSWIMSEREFLIYIQETATHDSLHKCINVSEHEHRKWGKEDSVQAHIDKQSKQNSKFWM